MAVLSFETSKDLIRSSYAQAQSIRSYFQRQAPPDFWDDDHRNTRETFKTDLSSGAYDNAFHPFELGIDLPEDAEDMPDNWQRVFLEVDRQTIPSILAPADDPQVLDVFFTGLLATTPYYKHRLLERSQRGISTLVINLPDPGISIGYADHYRAIFQKAALSPPREIKAVMNGLPLTLSGHSTGAYLAAEAFSDAFQAKHITDTYKSSTLMGLFSTAAYTQSRLKRLFYDTIYNPLVADKAYGETLPDRIHKYLLDEPDVRSSVRDMVHRQIKYMIAEASPLISHAQDIGFSDDVKQFPITLLHGSKDYVACPLRAFEIGNAMNANNILCGGMWHNPALESEEASRLWDDNTLRATLTRRMPAWYNQVKRNFPCPDNVGISAEPAVPAI